MGKSYRFGTEYNNKNKYKEYAKIKKSRRQKQKIKPVNKNDDIDC